MLSIISCCWARSSGGKVPDENGLAGGRELLEVPVDGDAVVVSGHRPVARAARAAPPARPPLPGATRRTTRRHAGTCSWPTISWTESARSMVGGTVIGGRTYGRRPSGTSRAVTDGGPPASASVDRSSAAEPGTPDSVAAVHSSARDESSSIPHSLNTCISCSKRYRRLECPAEHIQDRGVWMSVTTSDSVPKREGCRGCGTGSSTPIRTPGPG